MVQAGLKIQEYDFIVAEKHLNLIMLTFGQQEQFDCMIALFSISHLTEFSAGLTNPEGSPGNISYNTRIEPIYFPILLLSKERSLNRC